MQVNSDPKNLDPKPMLDFERQMFLDILESDGLMVCAKGMNDGLVILNLLRAHNDPTNLIFVMNSADFEEKYFMQKLNIEPLPITSAEREKAYLKGGVNFVSTRILVVDLLKDRVPVERVTGIIVLRAHSILESCQEAFALRLYRQKNKTGFIKAFSHSAERFTFGFAHVDKVMRSLFVKELYLWPRFHGLVLQCLKTRQPSVIEFNVPLSQKTALIQTYILDIMNYTTKELKRINKTLDFQEITVENCITKKFHKILQSQLDTIWHQLSTRTKELIRDLKIMRGLIMYGNLIHHDAVLFYSLVSKYRTTEYAKVNSGWILLDSAARLFEHSRARVFNANKEFQPELSAKWKYLSEILTCEIPADRKKYKNQVGNPIKILILCNDSRTCIQLNQYFTVGPEACMLKSAHRNEVDVSALSQYYQPFKNMFKFDKEKPNVQKIPPKQRDSIKPETSAEPEFPGDLETFIRDEIDDEDLNKTNFALSMTIVDRLLSSETTMDSAINSTQFEPFTQMGNVDVTRGFMEDPLVYIQTFKNNEDGVCLEDFLRNLKPNYIIMYHSDVTAARQIEIYESRKDSTFPPLIVYFLVHTQTTEEQSYLTTLKREKQAFELLIQAKSTMVIPTYQDGKSELPAGLEREEPTIFQRNTRKAGGQDMTKQEKPRVIVDMREFRSDLPALLHKKGIDTDPVTITIGDYILTPEICVERKSLSDLIGSLNSGRLYTQCTQMSRNYARPMLLIEFDQNRPFQLQGHYVVSNDISSADVRQKLQLLTIHFPRLKLIWSPSPYATAELFFELKQGRAQPDATQAMALGDEASVDGLIYERYNPRVHDFLLKLPGVNSKNIGRIMNKGISMDNLITLNKDEISEIIGNKSDGEVFWKILHNQHKPSNISVEGKNIKKNRFGKPMGFKKF